MSTTPPPPPSMPPTGQQPMSDSDARLWAMLGHLSGIILSGLGFLLVVGSAAGAYGIANERKWGYGLGVAMSFLPFILRLLAGQSLSGGSIINLMFEVALVALLLHTMSREYVRIWFR